AFAKVKTLIADGTDMSAYYKNIKAASKRTGERFGDMSEAVYSAISASVAQEDAVAFTEDAVKLAKGGFTSTATSVDVLTTAINAYGLAASDATHISDVLITTQNLGKTTVDELASSMGQTIPIANSSGAAIEDLAAQYAVLTKNGIATAEAGTGIKAMLSELNSSSSEISEKLKELTGSSFSELQASGKSTADILQILNEYAAESGQKLSDLFGSVEAGSAALTIVKDGGKDFNNILSQMSSSAGATQKAYETMANTLEERFNKLKNKMVLAFTSVGEELLPEIEEIVEYVDEHADEIADTIADVGKAVGEVVEVLGGLIEILWENKEAVAATVTALVAFKTAMAIGNVISATVTAVKAFKTATDAAAASQKIMNTVGASNPYVLIASAIVAVVGAIVTFAVATDSATEKINNMRDKAEDLIDTSKEYQEQAEGLEDVKEKYDDIYNSEKSAYDKGLELEALQDRLIDQYGPQASGIDLVNGEYAEQLGLLDKLIKKNSELAKSSAIAGYNEYLNAEKAERDISYHNSNGEWSSIGSALDRNDVQSVLETIASKNNNLKIFKNDAGAFEITVTGNTSQKRSVYQDIVSELESKGLYNSDSEDVRNFYNENVYKLEEYTAADERNKSIVSAYEEATTTPKSTTTGTGATTRNSAEYYAEQGKSRLSTQGVSNKSSGTADPLGSPEEYEEKRAELDYQYNMGQLAAVAYAAKLGELRDSYLEPNSSEWRSVNVLIHNLTKSKITGTGTGGLSTAPSAYTTARKKLDYEHSMGYINDDDYYAQIGVLRDEHLEADSDEWRAANVEIHNYEESKKKSSATSSTKSGNTISIDSYIPTIWDDVEESNRKLAASVGLSLAGNSGTGKIIAGLDEITTVANQQTASSVSENKETTLGDVVSAINSLEKADENRKISLTVDLHARDLAIGTVAVEDINDITRMSGQSP
ncbi:MAG: phage tail tape measure protein, partial [Oscillospiraceae bacterium]|nr:phage tail tape measure protein [Oscillospiraceae bacterium]